MSKQSEAKKQQGNRTKPVTCSNCAHHTSKIEVHSYWQVESERRCGLGGFAVNKTGTCDEHAPIKENANGKFKCGY